MKRLLLFLLLMYVVIYPAMAEESYGVLFLFKGKVLLYRENEGIKVTQGMVLEKRDILDTNNGTAVVYYSQGNYFGFFEGNSARITNPKEYRILNDHQKETLLATENIEEILNQGTPLPGFHQGERKKNVNLILVLDVSTSMRKFFKEIQLFVDETILQNVLLNRDYFYFYTFGEKIRERVDRVLEIPGELDLLQALVHSVAPDEEATDIGLALWALDERLSGAFPYAESIIFFITDGKNDPHKNSPYAGIDIYAEGAFSAFDTVKKGKYKVMLLSIGKETAAKDLSGPLGGEYIEVSANLTAGVLNGLISDFTGDIELITPADIGKVGKQEVRLKIGFLSSYVTDKDIKIAGLYYSLDGGEKQQLAAVPESILVRAHQQAIAELLFPLPKDLSRGEHKLQLELVSGNMSLAGSVQEILFSYAPFPWLLFFIILIAVLVVAALIIIVIRKNG